MFVITNIDTWDSLGWSTGIGFSQHDERHKKLRRVIASALHPSAARSYASQHLDTTLDLLRRISKNPGAFGKHTSDVFGEFIIRLAYGYNAVENDTLLVMVREAFSYLAKGTALYFPVNDFPIREPFSSAYILP
jgi:cytochrome P450